MAGLTKMKCLADRTYFTGKITYRRIWRLGNVSMLHASSFLNADTTVPFNLRILSSFLCLTSSHCGFQVVDTWLSWYHVCFWANALQSFAGPMFFYWAMLLYPYYNLLLCFLFSSFCRLVSIVGLGSSDW